MNADIGRFISDALLWAICIVSVGFLHAAGWVDDPALGLAGGALWLAIRAQRAANVSSVRKKIPRLSK